MIEVGDLVVVVGGVCEHEEKEIGRIFAVPALRFDKTTCRHCGKRNEVQWHAVCPTHPQTGYPLVFLKKIPPLGELETRGVDEQAKVG